MSYLLKKLSNATVALTVASVVTLNAGSAYSSNLSCQIAVNPEPKELSLAAQEHILSTHPNLVKSVVEFLYLEDGGFMLKSGNLQQLKDIFKDASIIKKNFKNIPVDHSDISSKDLKKQVAALSNLENATTKELTYIAESWISKTITNNFHLQPYELAMPSHQLLNELSETATRLALPLEQVMKIRYELLPFFNEQQNRQFLLHIVRASLPELGRLTVAMETKHEDYTTAGNILGWASLVGGVWSGLLAHSWLLGGAICYFGCKFAGMMASGDEVVRTKSINEGQSKVTERVESMTTLLLGRPEMASDFFGEKSPLLQQTPEELHRITHLEVEDIANLVPKLEPTTKIHEIKNYGQEVLEAELAIGDEIARLMMNYTADLDFLKGLEIEINQKPLSSEKIRNLFDATTQRSEKLKPYLNQLDELASNLDTTIEKMTEFHYHLKENVDQATKQSHRDYNPSELAYMERDAELTEGLKSLEQLSEHVNQLKIEASTELGLISSARRILNHARFSKTLNDEQRSGINKLLESWGALSKKAKGTVTLISN